MKKTFYLFSLLFLLNGCVESVALLGSSVGGASSGRLLQSSLQSTISYGIKKQTGKTPLGHALAYAEIHNPEKKKETCISFIEKTKSEFCTIAKKKISLTNKAIKEKVLTTAKIISKSSKPIIKEAATTPSQPATIELPNNIKNKFFLKNKNYVSNLNQLKESPRELAITFQNELKKKIGKYLVKR